MAALTAKQKITVARMNLIYKRPFFATILLLLKDICINDNKNELNAETMSTMAVDAKGNLYFNTNFLNALSIDTVETILCHEVMHVILRHCYRFPTEENKLNPQIWNIATDLVINNILFNKENLSIPKVEENYDSFNKGDRIGLIPNSDESYTITFEGSLKEIPPLTIDLRNKISEAIYWEIINHIKPYVKNSNKSNGNFKIKCGDKGSREENSYDRIIFGNNPSSSSSDSKDGKGSSSSNKSSEVNTGLSDSEKIELDRKWNSAVAQAVMNSTGKTRSNNGSDWMSRLLKELNRPQINWKAALSRFIKEVIPYDFSYRMPHKKSISTGVYMPMVYKKPELITLAIDVSGSIGDDELRLLISEVYGITRVYSNLDIRVLFWSTKVDSKNDKIYKPNNITSLLSVKPSSTGGTSLSCVEEYIKSNSKKESSIIYFTDGYVEDDPFLLSNKKRLFIISPTGDTSTLEKYGTCIKLKEE